MMVENEMDVSYSTQYNTTTIGDIIPGEDDLVASGTDNDLQVYGDEGSNTTMVSPEAEAARAAAAAQAAARAVSSVEPPEEFLSDCTSRGRLVPRIVTWAIWLLGLAIVLHVCWMAVTGGKMGAAGLWEVFSLLVVVLVQELLQFLGFAVAQPTARQLERGVVEVIANNMPVIAIEQEVAMYAKDFGSEEIAESAEKKVELNVENAELSGDKPTTEPPVLKTLYTTPAGEVFEALPVAKPSAPEDEDATPSQRKVSAGDLLADALTDDGVTGCSVPTGKTPWGMDVGAFIADNPTSKVPVWDLYAPSEVSSTPPTTAPDIVPDAHNPTITVTSPAQPSSTDAPGDELY